MVVQVKFKDLLKLNAPDWPLVTTGIIMSAVVGCLFPLMSIFFSEMLEVRREGGGEKEGEWEGWESGREEERERAAVLAQ